MPRICTSHAPWKAEFGGKAGGWGILSAREEAIAYVRQDMIHDEANAILMSCAPDLLAALERLAHPMADDDDLYHAFAVIAKAKGQQP